MSTNAFKLWCWRRLLKVPWTARRSNQSFLKEINTEYSLEGLMLNLKLQYFSHLTQRANSLKRPWCWERLRAGGEVGDRGWDGWMASSSQWCHSTISSSVTPFSSCPQSFLALESFPMSQLFASGGQSTGASVSASVLPMNIQCWFPLELTSLISFLSKGLSRILE